MICYIRIEFVIFEYGNINILVLFCCKYENNQIAKKRAKTQIMVLLTMEKLGPLMLCPK